jgi:anti-anti-sigma regulatory factor
MHSEIPFTNDRHVLTLKGELTIARAEELKAALSESLQGAASVRIQLSDAGAIDLSCLQLLCSAHRTAAALGKSLTLEGEVPPMIRETMKYAGFTRRTGCAFSPLTNCLGCGGD